MGFCGFVHLRPRYGCVYVASSVDKLQLRNVGDCGAETPQSSQRKELPPCVASRWPLASWLPGAPRWRCRRLCSGYAGRLPAEPEDAWGAAACQRHPRFLKRFHCASGVGFFNPLSVRSRAYRCAGPRRRIEVNSNCIASIGIPLCGSRLVCYIQRTIGIPLRGSRLVNTSFHRHTAVRVAIGLLVVQIANCLASIVIPLCGSRLVCYYSA